MQVQTREPAPPDISTLPSDVAEASTPPWFWRIYAGLTAYLGLPIIAAWIAIAVAAVMFLPDFGSASGFGLVDLVPGNTPALQAQAVENRLFGSSLSDAQAVVVEHDPAGLPQSSLATIGRNARAIDASRPASAPLSRPGIARNRHNRRHLPVLRRGRPDRRHHPGGPALCGSGTAAFGSLNRCDRARARADQRREHHRELAAAARTGDSA